MQLLALACTLVLAAKLLYGSRAFYHDDAYISLHYAANFLRGHGLVWNPGEYVQGYTNFLHVLLVSFLAWCGMDLVLASQAIGLSAFLGVVAALFLFTRRDPLWHVPVMLALGSASLLVWSLGGLEGDLFAFLTSSGCLLLLLGFERPTQRVLFLGAGLALGLSTLCRPDGIVFVGIAGLWLLATHRRRPLSALVAFTVPCVLVIASYALWQYRYYGEIVPNTFHAKTGGDLGDNLAKGLHYLYGFATHPPYLPILVAISGLCVVFLRKRRAQAPEVSDLALAPLAFLASVIAAYAAFLLVVGGDQMPAYRLALPLIPPLCIMLYLILRRIFSMLPRARRETAGIVVTIAILAMLGLQIRYTILNPSQNPAALVGAAVGKYIARTWPEGSLVALNTAGSTPYHAPKHRYIDMLGLNDRHIARRVIERIDLPWQRVPGHRKGDGSYVLSRAPDYIIVGHAAGTDVADPMFLSDLEMGRDPRMAAEYEKRSVHLDVSGAETVPGTGFEFTFYQRRDRARQD